MDPRWRMVNLVCSVEGDEVRLTEQPVPTMGDLIGLFDRKELSKYLTDDELTEYDAIAGKEH